MKELDQALKGGAVTGTLISAIAFAVAFSIDIRLMWVLTGAFLTPTLLCLLGLWVLRGGDKEFGMQVARGDKGIPAADQKTATSNRRR